MIGLGLSIPEIVLRFRGSSSPPVNSFLLLDDGVSYLLLDDGVSKLILG